MTGLAPPAQTPNFSAWVAYTPWLVGIAGFAALYVPVYLWAADTIWKTEEHGHGPIILAVFLWLLWGLKDKLVNATDNPSKIIGGLIFLLGLVTYAIGRVFNISIFEIGSQILVVCGIILAFKGREALRSAWFPVIYLIFMIPLPGILVDAMTGPLKAVISNIVVNVLYFFDYPIARTGVMITIGQYQLMVADACSGLHSMFSLSALGTLFMYIMGRKSFIHNTVMLLAILPIAFISNIIRVIVLVLVTYHFGDEAGQGFIHASAGFLLMGVALASLFGLDHLISQITKPKTTVDAEPQISNQC